MKKLLCQWCGKELNDGDQLRFEFSQEDFETVDNWRSVFEPGPTAQEPLLTCDKCRDGMLRNRAALDKECLEEEQRRRWLVYLYGLMGVLFGLGVVLILTGMIRDLLGVR